jgi:hypothetical protein
LAGDRHLIAIVVGNVFHRRKISCPGLSKREAVFVEPIRHQPSKLMPSFCQGRFLRHWKVRLDALPNLIILRPGERKRNPAGCWDGVGTRDGSPSTLLWNASIRLYQRSFPSFWVLMVFVKVKDRNSRKPKKTAKPKEANP